MTLGRSSGAIYCKGSQVEAAVNSRISQTAKDGLQPDGLLVDTGESF